MPSSPAQLAAARAYRQRQKAQRDAPAPPPYHEEERKARQARERAMPVLMDAAPATWRDDLRKRISDQWDDMRLKTPLERRVLYKQRHTGNKSM